MHPTTTRHTSLSTQRDDTFHMDYLDEEIEHELVLPAESMGSSSDLEERVQTTQHRLAALRQEADALEQEKLRFEELSRQQKEFMQGRAEMGEKLTKALAHLDRETYEAQRRVEQLLVIKDTYNHHLDVIDSLNPEQWNPQDLRQDLGHALGMIEEAREEYVRSASRVHLLTSGTSSASAAPAPAPAPGLTSPHASAASALAGPALSSASAAVSAVPLALNKATFRFWLFCGLGFTVPMALTALLIFFGWLIFR
jgi:hypothetical protein